MFGVRFDNRFVAMGSMPFSASQTIQEDRRFNVKVYYLREKWFIIRLDLGIITKPHSINYL